MDGAQRLPTPRSGRTARLGGTLRGGPRAVWLVLLCALAAGCGSSSSAELGGDAIVTDGEESGEGTEAPTSTVADIGGLETAGVLVVDVTLDPAAGTGAVSNVCLIDGRKYEAPDDADLAETTATIRLAAGGQPLVEIPFLASTLSGGSMVFGPVTGFFEGGADTPGSRDVVTLPYVPGVDQLLVVIEGQVLPGQDGGIDVASLPACTGTSGG